MEKEEGPREEKKTREYSAVLAEGEEGERKPGEKPWRSRVYSGDDTKLAANGDSVPTYRQRQKSGDELEATSKPYKKRDVSEEEGARKAGGASRFLRQSASMDGVDDDTPIKRIPYQSYDSPSSVLSAKSKKIIRQTYEYGYTLEKSARLLYEVIFTLDISISLTLERMELLPSL